MGAINPSTPWFAKRSQSNTYLNWEENGQNFLYSHNATIALDSNFYVFTVYNDTGR